MSYSNISGINNLKNVIQGPQILDQNKSPGWSNIPQNSFTALSYDPYGGDTVMPGTQKLKSIVTVNGQGTNTTPNSGNTTQQSITPDPNAYKNSQEYKDWQAQVQVDKNSTANMATNNQAQQDQTTSAYNAAREAKLAAVRAAIQASQSKFQTVIDNAPQEFQAQRNNVAAQNDINNLELRRNLGNMGYTPNEDASIIKEGNANNSANQQINQLDIAQKKTIQDAQNEITNLQAQGKFQEADAVNEYATKSLESINNLKQQLQTNLTNANATYTNDLKGLLDYATQQRQNQDVATQTALQNRLTLAHDQGKTIGADGSLVDTFETTRQKESDTIAKHDKEKNDYASSIKGLGNQMDYADAISKVKNDGDTTNDWKISLLQQERQNKIDTNLKNDIQTIGQYGKDFQAEIDKRISTNPSDPLIPYLKVAQAEKLSSIASNQLTQYQQQQKNALELWKQMGYATPEISSILGVPVGATTMDYIKTQNDTAKTQYDINKPYYNPNSGSSADKIKKTPYYSDVYNGLASTIENMEKNPKIMVKQADSSTKDWIRTPGSQQYNQIVSRVMGDPTLSEYEKYSMLADFNIPFKK